MDIHHSRLGRLFGYGTLVIVGHHLIEPLQLRNIPSPEHYKKIIETAKREAETQ